VIFIIALIYSSYIEREKKKQLSAMTPREVALMCTSDMATEFHIHPVLTINILGEKYTIPDNIGITQKCMSSIHTHEKEEGKLHVEAQVEKAFTL
jgi:hypothetical protein